ncbi:MAG: 30S ribosomal protein S20 [Caldithrix sp.]|nr:30S ribosomal protein S20 [Caldithrix sp.]
MAHHKSAKKRIRQTQKHRSYNRFYIRKLRTAIKDLYATTTKEEAEPKYRQIASLLDRLVRKNILHRNNADNKKSRLARFVNKLD